MKIFSPQTALEPNGVLNSSKEQALFHYHFLVPARVPGLVSLFFWHPVPSSFVGSGYGSQACPHTFLESCFLVPARVPGLVSLLFWHPVPSSLPGSGWGSGACLRSLSIIPGSGYKEQALFHHHFWFLARGPGLLSTLVWNRVSWFRLGFRGLSPFSFGILFRHHCRVLAGVPGLVSVLFWHPVPSSFPGSG